MKRTLIFPSEFITNKGGVPQSTISLVTGVANGSDFRVVLVCPKNSEMATTTFPSNVVVLTTRHSEWVMSRNRIIQTVYTVLDIFFTIRKYMDQYTWYVTNQPSTSSLIGLMPIVKYNELYINRGGDFSGKGMASRIIRKKIKGGKIKYAVGISKRQVQMLEDSGIPKGRVFLVHNGLPIPTIHYDSKQLTRESLKISTMGYLSDLKNQIEGVKLIKLCRDKGINASLNLYGVPDDDDSYQIKLASVIRELNMEKYINFCGFVSGEDLFQDTDVLISFSRTEGFGRSLVEGMLRKKPVIAWRGAGGPVDITADGKYGYLVERNDAADFFDVIRHILDYPIESDANVELSYAYAMRNFTEPRMVNTYVNLFKRVCV